MAEIIPRFEFRTFAQTFGLVADKIRRYSKCQDISESAEQYLVGSASGEHNVKVRGGRLDIKRLIEKRGQLERWKPTAVESFPLSREFVRATLLPALGLGDVELARSEYSINDMLSDLAQPRKGIWLASVFKRRFRFSIDTCPTEIDDLLINGAAISSVAVESDNAEAVLAVMAKLGLTEYENINYPLALRRIMGLAPLPKEGTHG